MTKGKRAELHNGYYNTYWIILHYFDKSAAYNNNYHNSVLYAYTLVNYITYLQNDKKILREKPSTIQYIFNFIRVNVNFQFSSNVILNFLV